MTDERKGNYLIRFKTTSKDGEVAVKYEEQYDRLYRHVHIVTKAKKVKYEAEGYTDVTFTISELLEKVV